MGDDSQGLSIAKAYLPDGIREFQDFPSASLGWMMYIGMAVAKMWDTEGMEQREQSDACIDSAESRQNSTEGQWEIYGNIEDLYAYMRDKRGYDAMDEYIREEILPLVHQHLEPGTKAAFNGFVSCLHQLYLMGAAIQLKRMGYHMTKMN